MASSKKCPFLHFFATWKSVLDSSHSSANDNSHLAIFRSYILERKEAVTPHGSPHFCLSTIKSRKQEILITNWRIPIGVFSVCKDFLFQLKPNNLSSRTLTVKVNQWFFTITLISIDNYWAQFISGIYYVSVFEGPGFQTWQHILPYQPGCFPHFRLDTLKLLKVNPYFFPVDPGPFLLGTTWFLRLIRADNWVDQKIVYLFGAWLRADFFVNIITDLAVAVRVGFGWHSPWPMRWRVVVIDGRKNAIKRSCQSKMVWVFYLAQFGLAQN